MYQKIKEFIAGLVALIKEGNSDGKKLSKLIVEGVKSGVLYVVLRDANGQIEMDKDTASPKKGTLEFGEQLLPIVLDIYLSVSDNLGTDGSAFGEFKRICTSACKYASDELGLEWAPKRTAEGFRISTGDEPAAIAGSLRKGLHDENKFVDVVKASVSLLKPEVREALLAELTEKPEPAEAVPAG